MTSWYAEPEERQRVWSAAVPVCPAWGPDQPSRTGIPIDLGDVLQRHDQRVDAMHSDMSVNVHALVQDTHDVDDAFGADPIEQRV